MPQVCSAHQGHSQLCITSKSIAEISIEAAAILNDRQRKEAWLLRYVHRECSCIRLVVVVGGHPAGRDVPVLPVMFSRAARAFAFFCSISAGSM